MIEKRNKGDIKGGIREIEGVESGRSCMCVSETRFVCLIEPERTCE